MTEGFATIRELHDVELRITEAIQRAMDKIEKTYSPGIQAGVEACRVANLALDEAKGANGRIDSIQKLVIPILAGWLVTALGAAWALWRTVQSIKQLGL